MCLYCNDKVARLWTLKGIRIHIDVSVNLCRLAHQIPMHPFGLVVKLTLKETLDNEISPLNSSEIHVILL
jgi:hypothetical protein